MKRLLIFLFFFTSLTSSAQAANEVLEQMKNIDVRLLAAAQNARYGRELYRKGDYEEAAKIFQHILKTECDNKFAQYHLQQIAKKESKYAYLNDYLQSLPCGKLDFAKEDFLPSNIFYEYDNDLLVEQVYLYKRRSETPNQAIQAKADELERKVADLTAALQNAKNNRNEDKKTLNQKYLEVRAESRQMEKDLARLKKEETQAKPHAQLAAPANDKNKTGRRMQKVDAGKNASPEQSIPAIQEINEFAVIADIQNEPMKPRELTSLQDRLNRLQLRLKDIETALAKRNERVEAVQIDLSVIQ